VCLALRWRHLATTCWNADPKERGIYAAAMRRGSNAAAKDLSKMLGAMSSWGCDDPWTTEALGCRVPPGDGARGGKGLGKVGAIGAVEPVGHQGITRRDGLALRGRESGGRRCGTRKGGTEAESVVLGSAPGAQASTTSGRARRHCSPRTATVIGAMAITKGRTDNWADRTQVLYARNECPRHERGCGARGR